VRASTAAAAVGAPAGVLAAGAVLACEADGVAGRGEPLLAGGAGSVAGRDEPLLAGGAGEAEALLAALLADDEALAETLGDEDAGQVTLGRGWRVEFYWRSNRQGQRRAYFQYRSGSGQARATRYGGSVAKACTLHPERVRAFLRRARWTPVNLPEGWYGREGEGGTH